MVMEYLAGPDLKQVIRSRSPLIVADATQDPRFSDSDLVDGESPELVHCSECATR